MSPATYGDEMEVGVGARGDGGATPLPDDARSDGSPPRRYRSFRRGLRVNPLLDLAWRVAVLTVGGLVVAAGIALLALPGPGWATIVVGLMILASEFAWARRSLDWTKAQALNARDRAMAPEVRRRNQALSVVVALLVVAGIAWYALAYGFPGPAWDWLQESWGR